MKEHLEILKIYKFEKQLNRLIKKMRHKSVLIYGAGLFFKSVKENYDIEKLNIIGICDKRYQLNEEGNIDMGYPIVPYEKILDYKPDYILIATMKTYNIYQSFKTKKIKDAKIKVLPLVEKPFFDLLKEALE